jgi:hypothetical protein
LASATKKVWEEFQFLLLSSDPFDYPIVSVEKKEGELILRRDGHINKGREEAGRWW